MSQIFRDEAEIFRILKRLLYFYVKNYAINSATAVVFTRKDWCRYSQRRAKFRQKFGNFLTLFRGVTLTAGGVRRFTQPSRTDDVGEIHDDREESE